METVSLADLFLSKRQYKDMKNRENGVRFNSDPEYRKQAIAELEKAGAITPLRKDSQMYWEIIHGKFGR